MTLSDKEKLDLALEIMSERDVGKFSVVCDLAERKEIDIYEALTKYEQENE